MKGENHENKKTQNSNVSAFSSHLGEPEHNLDSR